MLECLRVAALAAGITVGVGACDSGRASGPGPQVPAPVGPVESAAPTHELAPAAPSAVTGSRIPLVHTNLFLPGGAGPSARVPFVLFLHGLGTSGEALVNQLGLPALAQKRRFAYVAPDGTPDTSNRLFWNATLACCDFDHKNPDHVYLLRELLEEVGNHPAIDRSRRYVLGYSNGGFMAHRLACEVPGIAAIASIGGSGPSDQEPCTPPAPVAVLQVHGDADGSIRYAGGPVLGNPTGAVHPGAEAVVAAWAARNGCGTPAAEPAPFDFEAELAGAESLVTRYPGCRRDVELWRVHGGGHVLAQKWPALEQVIAFLERFRSD